MQLECQLIGILGGGKFVLFDRDGGNVPQQCHEFVLKRGNPFLYRTRASAHLERRRSEKATTGENTPLQVIEERLTHPCQLPEAGPGAERRLYDFGVEDPLRFLHGGQLELLLASEMRIKAALADAGRGGEIPDGKAV